MHCLIPLNFYNSPQKQVYDDTHFTEVKFESQGGDLSPQGHGGYRGSTATILTWILLPLQMERRGGHVGQVYVTYRH